MRVPKPTVQITQAPLVEVIRQPTSCKDYPTKRRNPSGFRFVRDAFLTCHHHLYFRSHSPARWSSYPPFPFSSTRRLPTSNLLRTSSPRHRVCRRGNGDLLLLAGLSRKYRLFHRYSAGQDDDYHRISASGGNVDNGRNLGGHRGSTDRGRIASSTAEVGKSLVVVVFLD
jgi:hypothetical protein